MIFLESAAEFEKENPCEGDSLSQWFVNLLEK